MFSLELYNKNIGTLPRFWNKSNYDGHQDRLRIKFKKTSDLSIICSVIVNYSTDWKINNSTTTYFQNLLLQTVHKIGHKINESCELLLFLLSTDSTRFDHESQEWRASTMTTVPYLLHSFILYMHSIIHNHFLSAIIVLAPVVDSQVVWIYYHLTLR